MAVLLPGLDVGLVVDGRVYFLADKNVSRTR
jgi:hypothetical protein